MTHFSFRYYPLIIFVALLCLLNTSTAQAQTVVWSENFNAHPCDSLCTINGFTGTNGAWSVQSLVSEGAKANQWFVSCAENGNTLGSCGSGCANGGNNTLHIANVAGSPRDTTLKCLTGDCGAFYDAGKSTGQVLTNKRAESPVINLTGDSILALHFKYVEGGQDTLDNFTVDYYDGSTWTKLVDPDKTAGICPPFDNHDGFWTQYDVPLPSSANKNPNVKIGFHWVNNDDGTDNSITSVAIYDVNITIQPPLPVAMFSVSDTSFCVGTCITYTDKSTGGATSWRWAFGGGTPAAAVVETPSTVCYNSVGTYITRLVVKNATGADTAYQTIKVNNCNTITPGQIKGGKCVCSSFQLPFTITGVFVSGNVFTAQLSNASGSFSSPTTIGTFTSTSGGNISATIPCNAAAGAGYKIRIVGSSPATTGSAVADTIYEAPTSSFIVQPDTVCTGANVIATYTGTAGISATYTWNFDGGAATPGGTGQGPQEVNWSTQGLQPVTLSVTENGCTSSGLTTVAVYVALCTGVNNINSTGDIEIYPNPVEEQLTISSGQLTVNRISISDLLGKTIFTQVPLNGNTHIDVSQLNAGVYFVTVKCSNGLSVVKKFVKE